MSGAPWPIVALHGLTPRMRLAAVALAEGKSASLAAHAANCSLRTLTRWRAEPEFVEAVAAAQDAAFSEVLGELRRSARAALATVKALSTPATPGALRLKAATTVLRLALAVHETTALEARLARVEAALARRKGGA